PAGPVIVLIGTRRTRDPNVELPHVRWARSRSSLEHAVEVTRTSSSRTFARLWPSWSTPGRKARTSSRTFDRLACGSHGARRMVIRASSPRAFDRLACGRHGARQMVTRALSPRAFGRIVLDHTVGLEAFISPS